MATTAIEIVDRETREVIESFDVEGDTDRAIDKLEAGININLDHQRFLTRRV